MSDTPVYESNEPSDAIETFKRTIDMLLVSGVNGVPLADSINLPALNTLGAVALKYHDVGGKGEIADFLEPYQKNVLIRNAMDFGLFNSITPGEDEKYDADVYNEIKAVCKPFETSSWAEKNEIYMLEFLCYLGLSGSEIEEEDLEDDSSGPNYSEQSLYYLFNREHPSGHEEKKQESIKDEAISHVIGLIDDSSGFSDYVFENLNALKGFGIDLSRDDELYEHALESVVSAANRPSCAPSFASYFCNMYEFFRKVPKDSKKLLKEHISYLVFQDTLDSKQIADLLWSQEMYKRINLSLNFSPLLHVHVNNIDELTELVPDILNMDSFGKGYLKRTTDVKGRKAKDGMRYEKKMIDQAITMFVRNVDDKVMEDYSSVFRILFDTSFKEPLASYIVALVLEKEGKHRTYLFDYDYGFLNSWYDIGSLADRFNTYFHIDMFDKLMREVRFPYAKYFQDNIEKRIYSELADGDVEGIIFLKGKIGDKSISMFKDRFVECYNSKNKEDRSSEDSEVEDSSVFLSMAQRYKELFEKYPPEFFGEFQDKISAEFDTIIKVSADGGAPFKDVYEVNSLINALGDDINSLPLLKEKIGPVKKIIEERI